MIKRRHQVHHSGNNTYRAFRDDRGWVNIENTHTRNLTVVQDADWDDFVQIVGIMENAMKTEGDSE